MAEHLARIIGTEEDRINCPFYWKIGACRHGDQCSRTHFKPSSGQTLVLRHLYQNPPVALAIAEGQDVDDAAAELAQDQYEQFLEEVWEELSKFGEIEELVTVDNIGDHMIGNAYVKYCSENAAQNALKGLTGRYYGGKLIEAEFSPVTDFREARCRQFVDGCCTRGGYCNFMHVKHCARSLKKKLLADMYKKHPEYNENRDKLRPDLEADRDRDQWNHDADRRPHDGDRRGGYRREFNSRDLGSGGRGHYERRDYQPRNRDRDRDRDRDFRDRDFRDRDYRDRGQGYDRGYDRGYQRSGEGGYGRGQDRGGQDRGRDSRGRGRYGYDGRPSQPYYTPQASTRETEQSRDGEYGHGEGNRDRSYGGSYQGRFHRSSPYRS